MTRQDYVDTENNLHELDDASFAYLLPADCTPITPAEALAIRLSKTPPFVLADYKVLAQNIIDAHYETLYRVSVVNSAIGEEYQAAYNSAVAWIADTTKTPPNRIVALAETFGVTNVQAANVVVAKWTEAQSVAFDNRGAARLRAKAAIRAESNQVGVDEAVVAGKLAMEAVVFSV